MNPAIMDIMRTLQAQSLQPRPYDPTVTTEQLGAMMPGIGGFAGRTALKQRYGLDPSQSLANLYGGRGGRESGWGANYDHASYTRPDWRSAWMPGMGAAPATWGPRHQRPEVNDWPAMQSPYGPKGSSSGIFGQPPTNVPYGW